MRPREHRLTGLEPDNLLAFLALLGLLRALDAAQPAWRARVHWDVGHPPIRPVLTLRQSVVATSVAESAAAGCSILAKAHEFPDWKTPAIPRIDARRLLQSATFAGPAGRNRADVLSALFSDIAVKDEVVVPTPFCLLFGQGHQYFLDRFSAVAKQASVPQSDNVLKKTSRTSPGVTMERALFHVWERTDPTPAFRWDPAEDRRYALRSMDPSKDAARTVHGANRLAAIGLPALTTCPTTVASRIRLSTIAVRRLGGRDIEVTWPIWTRPASLQGIRALLTHPLLSRDEPDRSRLQALGVYELRRAARISAGKFLNFTRAEAI